MPLPYAPGDTGPEITAFQQWFGRYASSYAPLVDGEYGANDVGAVAQMQFRLGLPVNGRFGQAEADLTGYRPGTPAPTLDAIPLDDRVVAVVHRGTGGVIGEDYVSRICQGVPELIVEENPPWAATMGGLPVGTAGGFGDPSMNKAAKDAIVAAQAKIEQILAKNPRRGIMPIGYSAGAFVTAALRQWMLQVHPDNYVGSISIGDPTRPAGGCFYPFDASVDPGGCGVGSWHFGDVTDPRHCWLTNNSDPNLPDFYGKVPRGKVYEICSGAYNMVTDFAFTDLVAFMGSVVKNVPAIAEDAGISVPAALGALAGGPIGLGGFAIPLLIGGLQGLIGVGNPEQLTGTAAAGYAGRIALQFYAAGTRPHVTYHEAEVWPGCTYLQLGIQHARYWAGQYLGLSAAA